MNPFTTISEDLMLYQDELFFIIKDKYPVSPGHLLIISKQPRRDYFNLSDAEKSRLMTLIDRGKALIEKEYAPDGYNIGMNCGVTAGQTVMHFHLHLIPRYQGDMADPSGGVRHCVEGKGYY